MNGYMYMIDGYNYDYKNDYIYGTWDDYMYGYDLNTDYYTITYPNY